MPDSEQAVGNTIGYRDPEWVADQLGIDKQTVYKYLQDGTLPGLQLGRKWLISEKALVVHLDDMQRRQTLARRASGGNAPEGFMSKIQDDMQSILMAAEIEARQHSHNYIGQEHILLAIARSPESLAMKALGALKIDAKRLQASVDFIIAPGDPASVNENESIRLTPRAKRAVELAYAAASESDVSPGSVQLLAGLMGEGTGIGAGVLKALGVEPAQFAEAAAKVIGGEVAASRAGTPAASADPLKDMHPLTAREIEVLKLLAAGQTNEKMAANLSISVKTVERHIQNIYAKTGVTNRAEAAEYADRNNLT